MTRRYETKTRPATTYRECIQITCGSCGASAPRPDDMAEYRWNASSYVINGVEVKVSHAKGESYGHDGGDKKTLTWDICPDCFENKIVPVLTSLGIEPIVTEIDW